MAANRGSRRNRDVKMYATRNNYQNDDYNTIDIGAKKPFKTLREACDFLNSQNREGRSASVSDFDIIKDIYYPKEEKDY